VKFAEPRDPVALASRHLQVSDTLFEARRLPVPSGVSTKDIDSLAFFGAGRQYLVNQNFILSFELFQGDFENAIASLERALAIARERHTGIEQEPNVLARLARAHLGRGNLPRAAALADEALALARERGSVHGEIPALDARARVLLARGDAGDAGEVETLVERMAALAEDSGFRLYLPQAVELRADLAALRGDPAARERHLRAAQRLYAEIGATGHAARLANELRR